MGLVSAREAIVRSRDVMVDSMIDELVQEMVQQGQDELLRVDIEREMIDCRHPVRFHDRRMATLRSRLKQRWLDLKRAKCDAEVKPQQLLGDHRKLMRTMIRLGIRWPWPTDHQQTIEFVQDMGDDDWAHSMRLDVMSLLRVPRGDSVGYMHNKKENSTTGRRTQEADGACSEKLCGNITSDQQACFQL